MFLVSCRCEDCWHEDENIRAEMRQTGAIRRRVDAELLAAGITEFVSRDPITGERYVLRMGERGTFSLSGEEKDHRIQLEKPDAN